METANPQQATRPRFDFAAESRERDRLRQQSAEFIQSEAKLRKEFDEAQALRSPLARKIEAAIDQFKSIAGIDWWRQTEDDDGAFDSVGVKWWTGRDTPPTYSYLPDQNYWSYFVVGFTFVRRTFCIKFRLIKQPYKNTEEYFAWRRMRRAKKSNLDLE